MRPSDRASVFFLSLLLASVSCAITPTAVVENPPQPFSDVDRNPPPEVVRAEAAEIARFLRNRETGLLPAEVRHLARVIAVEAHRAGLPPAFVLAVIDVESGGRNFAVSKVGARGLMQILPATGEFVAEQIGVPWRGPSTLFDPAANVRLGVWRPTTGDPVRSPDAFAAARPFPAPTRTASWRPTRERAARSRMAGERTPWASRRTNGSRGISSMPSAGPTRNGCSNTTPTTW
jgi:hypothetical protein